MNETTGEHSLPACRGARSALPALLAVALFVLPAAAWSQDNPILKGAYLEAGLAPHGNGDTRALSAGALLSGLPPEVLRNGRTAYYWDVFGSHWRAQALEPGGRQDYWQVGIIGNLRYRFDDGRSPWFADAGFGISTMDHHYQTPSKQFSTDFQFTEIFAIGYSFGERRQYELSMRLQHVSNGGIKEPNPGENFIKLRGAFQF